MAQDAAVRDFVPRFYRWAIQALELSANELAPGTYPTDVPPTQSMDWDEFNRAFKEWLDLLGRMAKYEREYGDLDGFDPYAGQAGREMDRGRSTMEGVGY